MEKEQLQYFIDTELEKAVENYKKGVYTLDKAVGSLAVLSQIAANINDEGRIENISTYIWALRKENDDKLTKGMIE